MEQWKQAYRERLASFQNVQPLKEGGQKVVYTATCPDHGKVVVKIGKCDSQQTLERIRREVELLRELDSEFYPKNYEFLGLRTGEFLSVEEFVQGHTLGDCFSLFKTTGSAVELVRNLCLGLNLLWQRKEPVVHRDIKPDNVIIRLGNRPTIIDLGIARCLGMSSLTDTLDWRGPCTPAYAAPEQLTNRKLDIDWRTDQFALGILFVQVLLGGRHPFDPAVVGTGSCIPENILAGKWWKSSLCAPAFAHFLEVCSLMLGKEPHMRYRNPEMLIEELTALLREVR